MDQHNNQSGTFQKKLNLERLHNYASEKRQQGMYNDVTIKAGCEMIPANRLVLACYSKYFSSMFEIEMKERYEKTVKLQDCNGKSVRTLIEFIYSGNITIDGENVMQLLATADYLQIDDAKHLCFEYLRANIALDNWSTVLSAYNLYHHDSLLNQVCWFVGKYLKLVSPSDQFKNLSKEMLISLINNLNRSITDETSIYEAIMDWIKKDEVERKNEFPDLLNLIDLYKLPLDFLEDIVANEPLVKENNVCLNIVISCVKKQFKTMRLRDNGPRIVGIGGAFNASKVTEVFNLSGKPKAYFPDLPNEMYYSSSHKLSQFIYCIGSRKTVESNELITTVLQMDTSGAMEWKKLAISDSNRRFMATTVFNDRLVVAGGFKDGDELTSDTESYNPAIDQWEQLAKLNHPRFGHALVVCKGFLYALGGYDEKSNLSSVERLEKICGHWKDVEPMRYYRVAFAAVQCNGYIYATGGFYESSGKVVLKIVERYSPVEKKWAYMRSMNVERYYHATCVLKGKIYVVGGWNQKDEPVSTIECYNPTSNTWDIIDETDEDFVFHSLVVI